MIALSKNRYDNFRIGSKNGMYDTIYNKILGTDITITPVTTSHIGIGLMIRSVKIHICDHIKETINKMI